MGTGSNTGFTIFDHTADIGLQIYGNEVSDLFEHAARGMFAIIFHESLPKIESKGEFRIKLQASDLEQLLVDWLDELLYIFTIEHIVFSSYRLSIDTQANTLDATVSGQIVADEELRKTCEIKAVTYHMLSVKKTNHWSAKVLFDI